MYDIQGALPLISTDINGSFLQNRKVDQWK